MSNLGSGRPGVSPQDCGSIREIKNSSATPRPTPTQSFNFHFWRKTKSDYAHVWFIPKQRIEYFILSDSILPTTEDKNSRILIIFAKFDFSKSSFDQTFGHLAYRGEDRLSLQRRNPRTHTPKATALRQEKKLDVLCLIWLLMEDWIGPSAVGRMIFPNKDDTVADTQVIPRKWYRGITLRARVRTRARVCKFLRRNTAFPPLCYSKEVFR